MTVGTVVVRGWATVPGQPDELEVSLTVSAAGRSAMEAVEETERLGARLGGVLGDLAVPESARSTSGLTVREEFERIEGRWAQRGYRASNHVVVRLERPECVGRLMSEAIARAQARVDGPRWRIGLDSPVRAEACRRAAANARRKAEAYAAALGMRLGDVIRVAEAGTDRADGGRERPGAGAASAPTEMQVQHGRVDVEAAVEVTFALEPA